MVELRRAAGLHHRDVVDDRGQMRKHLGELGARLAMAGELIARTEHGGVGADERIALAVDDGGRERLAFELRKLGLVVEEFELRRRASHEQVDDGLGLRRVVGQARAHAGAGGRELAHGAIGDEGGEGDLTDADAAVLEEVASGDVGAGHGRESCWFLVLGYWFFVLGSWLLVYG